MNKDNEHASSLDPRHLAELFDRRNNRLKPVSCSISTFYNAMPKEVRKRVAVNVRIKKIHEQFSQIVDPFILEHTNSVYLLRQKDVLCESDPKVPAKAKKSDQEVFDLVVYVDNSLVAAELNARRELVRLKYREQFNVIIDVFEIRISRGSYKEKHPFEQVVSESHAVVEKELTQEDIEQIEQLVENIPEGRLRESFVKAITAQKRFPDGNE